MLPFPNLLTIIVISLALLLISNIGYSNAQRLSDFNNNDNETNQMNTINSSTVISDQFPVGESNIDTNSFLSSDELEESFNPVTLLERLQRPIVGSFGDDRISGTQETDVIIGFSGSDTITGLNGSDAIQGNEGQDKLYGNQGDDILQGGIGSDQLYGGEGNDILAAGGDDDFLSGEMGNDKLYGDIGDDILVGGSGADYFDCGEGVDVVADFNIQEGDDRAGNCEELIEKP